MMSGSLSKIKCCGVVRVWKVMGNKHGGVRFGIHNTATSRYKTVSNYHSYRSA